MKCHYYYTEEIARIATVERDANHTFLEEGKYLVLLTSGTDSVPHIIPGIYVLRSTFFHGRRGPRKNPNRYVPNTVFGT